MQAEGGQKMSMKIGFLLLCGGKSSRMGTPKALLEVKGRTLLETVAEAGKNFDEKIIFRQ